MSCCHVLHSSGTDRIVLRQVGERPRNQMLVYRGGGRTRAVAVVVAQRRGAQGGPNSVHRGQGQGDGGLVWGRRSAVRGTGL